MPARIDIDKQAIADFCHRWHVTELALFGSVLREDFSPDSDVDVLVTFEEGADVGLLGFSKMRRELVEIFGRSVDLGTKRSVKPRLKEQVVASAEVIFAA
jgi:predicted nucleotidyltransferase